MYIRLFVQSKPQKKRGTLAFPATFMLASFRSTVSLKSSTLCFGIHTDVWIWLAVPPETVHKRLTRLICILHPWKKDKKIEVGEQKAADSISRQTGWVYELERLCSCCLFGFGSLTGPSAVAAWCLKDVSRSRFWQAPPLLIH